MKTKLVLLMTSVICIAACNKGENKSIEKTSSFSNRALSSMENAGDEAANPGNIYDSVGYWHNQILSAIQPCVSNYMNADSVSGCIVQLAVKNGHPINKEVLDSIQNIIAKRDSNFRQAINNVPYSLHTKSLMDSLLSLVRWHAENKNADYSSIREPIVSFENRVMMDKELTVIEARALLTASSVARYSIFYWMKLDEGGMMLRFKDVFKWVAAVTSDIGTALTSGDPYSIADASDYAYWMVVYGMP